LVLLVTDLARPLRGLERQLVARLVATLSSLVRALLLRRHLLRFTGQLLLRLKERIRISHHSLGSLSHRFTKLGGGRQAQDELAGLGQLRFRSVVVRPDFVVRGVPREKAPVVEIHDPLQHRSVRDTHGK
jgi:hypothetical protein